MRRRNSQQIKETFGLWLFVLIMSLAFALLGWVPSSHAQEKSPPRGGTLKMTYREPPHLNPAILSGVPVGLPGVQVFAGLIQHGERFQPQPYLAERWEVSPNGRIYTFHLVKGATFHDGRPITAEDVKFSLELVKDNHPFGKTMFGAVEAVDASEPQTVVIRLAYAHPALMAALHPLLLPILPKHVYGSGEIRKHPANLKPIGSGPFKFVEWVRGRYLTLERYENFFRRRRPYLDRLVFEYIPDVSTRAVALETGRIHVVPRGLITIVDALRLAKLPHLELTTKGEEAYGSINLINLNLRNPYLKHLKVRQAIAHALDREFIVKEILLGLGQPATGPIVSGSPFYNPNVTRYEYNLDKANRLLDEAGFKRGPDGVRFSLTLDDGNPGQPELQQNVAQYVREQLKKVGVEAVIRSSPDTATFAARIGAWNYDMTLDFPFTYSDPVIGVERLYITSNIRKVIWTNTMGYSNPTVDELFVQARTEQDPKRRKQLYHRLQEILVDDLPMIWLNEVAFFTVYNNEFGGIPMDVWGQVNPFDGVYWKKGKAGS